MCAQSPPRSQGCQCLEYVELDLCTSELHVPRLKSSLGKMKCWGFPIAPIPRAHQRLAEIHFSWLGYEHIYKGLTWARQSWNMIRLKYFIPRCLLHYVFPYFLITSPCHWWDYMHPSRPAREDVAFSNLDIHKVNKLLFSENFCLEEKCSLLGWLSFITQIAEQMSRGHPQLAYPFKNA